MHTKVTVLLLVTSSVLINASAVQALKNASKHYHKPANEAHMTSTKRYGCSFCSKIVESSSFPATEEGKCPKRANLIGVGHAWGKLSESGSNAYKCSYCLAMISTKSSPSTSTCQKSPTKNAIGAWGHQWQKM